MIELLKFLAVKILLLLSHGITLASRYERVLFLTCRQLTVKQEADDITIKRILQQTNIIVIEGMVAPLRRLWP